MKNDLSYAASDCFETFPFPRDETLVVGGSVDVIGERLYATRAQLLVDQNQGLTTTYNQLKDPGCTDPRILALRTLHEQMDRAVLDAYGWTDVVVPPYCPLTAADRTALAAFEDEVIDRLFALNAERAREEELLGSATTGARPKAKAAAGATKKGRKKKGDVDDQGGLF